MTFSVSICVDLLETLPGFESIHEFLVTDCGPCFFLFDMLLGYQIELLRNISELVVKAHKHISPISKYPRNFHKYFHTVWRRLDQNVAISNIISVSFLKLIEYFFKTTLQNINNAFVHNFLFSPFYIHISLQQWNCSTLHSYHFNITSIISTFRFHYVRRKTLTFSSYRDSFLKHKPSKIVSVL